MAKLSKQEQDVLDKLIAKMESDEPQPSGKRRGKDKVQWRNSQVATVPAKNKPYYGKAPGLGDIGRRADGTPDADYDKLISTLKSFETEFANYHFVDIHNAGDNGFTDDQYGDFEHLNRNGSQKLRRMIAGHLQQIKAGTLEVKIFESCMNLREARKILNRLNAAITIIL